MQLSIKYRRDTSETNAVYAYYNEIDPTTGKPCTNTHAEIVGPISVLQEVFGDTEPPEHLLVTVEWTEKV